MKPGHIPAPAAGSTSVKRLADSLRKAAAYARDTTDEDTLDAKRWAQYLLSVVSEVGSNLAPVENIAIASAIASGTSISDVIGTTRMSRYIVRTRLRETPEIAGCLDKDGPLRAAMIRLRERARTAGIDELFSGETAAPTEEYWVNYLEPETESIPLTPEATSLVTEWCASLDAIAQSLDAASECRSNAAQWATLVLHALADARTATFDFEGFLLRYALSVGLKASVVSRASGVSLRVVTIRVEELQAAEFAEDIEFEMAAHQSRSLQTTSESIAS